MSDFKTELETGKAANPTILESGEGGARTVLEPGASEGRGGGLGSGDSFGNYRIVERLRVTSAEADLYVVTRLGEARRFTLKLYRFGIAPKGEILAKVQALRWAHIVEIIEIGERDGCHYEVQEFVEHGSLADMLKEGTLPEAKIREALKEIAEALTHLHEVDVLHRDIKPSNILVRSKEPNLDLVLTDFGISSITDLSLVYSAVRRTPAYSAPEASTPVLVRKSTDWWSVGIILIEMLVGQHPFSGMDDLAISLHLATKPVPIPKSLSEEWQLIIKGLLTRDPRKRWGFEQVSKWLGGARAIPVHFESEVAGTARPYSYRPYKFAGQDFFDSAELATALAKKWDEAVKRVGRLDILKWVKEQLADADMANSLQDVADDKDLDEYQKVTVSLLVLNPQLPPIWEDAVIDLAWMQVNPKLAVTILESSIPQWVQVLRSDTWLQALKERRRQLWHTMQEVPKLNRELADRLILGPAEVAHAEATLVRDATFSSESPVVDQALKKTEISDAEAILLAACHRSLLWSKEQEKIRKVEEATRKRELENAERERQRKLQEAAEIKQRRERRKQRFDWADILGWAALGSCLLCFGAGFFLVIPVALSGLATYFIIDWWRHAPQRPEMRGGHKVAIGVLVAIPLIICVGTLSSNAMSQADAKKRQQLAGFEQRKETQLKAIRMPAAGQAVEFDFPVYPNEWSQRISVPDRYNFSFDIVGQKGLKVWVMPDDDSRRVALITKGDAPRSLGEARSDRFKSAETFPVTIHFSMTPLDVPKLAPLNAFSGMWVGSVSTIQVRWESRPRIPAELGRKSLFKVRLEVDQALESARLWIEGRDEYVTLPISSRHKAELQFRGRLPNSPIPGKQEVTVRADGTMRVITNADNGDWSYVQGWLSRQ